MERAKELNYFLGKAPFLSQSLFPQNVYFFSVVYDWKQHLKTLILLLQTTTHRAPNPPEPPGLKANTRTTILTCLPRYPRVGTTKPALNLLFLSPHTVTYLEMCRNRNFKDVSVSSFASNRS